MAALIGDMSFSGRLGLDISCRDGEAMTVDVGTRGGLLGRAVEPTATVCLPPAVEGTFVPTCSSGGRNGGEDESCRNGSPGNNDTGGLGPAVLSRELSTDIGRLADSLLSRSVNSSRGELRILKNSAMASVPSDEALWLEAAPLIPLAALIMLGTRRALAGELVSPRQWREELRVPGGASNGGDGKLEHVDAEAVAARDCVVPSIVGTRLLWLCSTVTEMPESTGGKGDEEEPGAKTLDTLRPGI